MANSTLHDDYRVITSTNREYQRNRDRWEFLMYSYVGGEEYRRQAYLTKYKLETGDEYNQRLMTTPLDNHCQSVIGVYISYLFREKPERELESWAMNPSVEEFLEDADMDGRSFDAFMKDVAIWSSVFGHCWIVMTKPNIGAQTLGEEQVMGVRPYVNLITPLAVMDWKWTRQPNGAYELTYLKYVEEIVDKSTTIRTWTKDTIETWVTDENTKEAVMTIVEPNELGMIPAVIAYNKRSIVRGIGVSDIADIADIQRLIYNYNSEIEQSIRLDGHPSLVVTPDTQYGSGAGAVIVIPENSDPGLKPYVLEHGGANVQSIHNSIQQLVDAIDRLSNTGGVRGTETRTLSGVAMEVEFSLLNARLAEKADNLELAEEQLWKIFARYQGKEYAGEIEYPGSFNVRDTQREYQQLQVAKSAATDPAVLRVIDEQLLELMGEEEELLPYNDLNPIPGRTYPDGEPIPESLPPLYIPATDSQVPAGQNCANCEYYKSSENYCIKFDAVVRPVYWCAKWDGEDDEMDTELTPEEIKQIQDMLMEGMTNAEIMAAMPDIDIEDIVYAAAEAARAN